jgi:hypothetical protein
LETQTKRTLAYLSLPTLSLAIALMSLASSFFQSWNYARNIESVQRNVLRAESLRTCKDIIDVFFQLRLLAEEANRDRSASQAMPMKLLAYKFGALGTYLANFRDEAVRQRYTALSFDLLRVATESYKLAASEFDALYARIDKVFALMNDDCAHAAQLRLL